MPIWLADYESACRMYFYESYGSMVEFIKVYCIHCYQLIKQVLLFSFRNKQDVTKNTDQIYFHKKIFDLTINFNKVAVLLPQTGVFQR